MPNCEMCGKEDDALTEVQVEGASLSVCNNCKKFGSNTNTKTESRNQQNNKQEEVQTGTGYGLPEDTINDEETYDNENTDEKTSVFEPQVEELVYNYEERIRKAREEQSISQKELARLINEKQSLISRLENGRSLPSEDVRRKLEKQLNIELTSAGGT